MFTDVSLISEELRTFIRRESKVVDTSANVLLIQAHSSCQTQMVRNLRALNVVNLVCLKACAHIESLPSNSHAVSLDEKKPQIGSPASTLACFC